MIYVDLKGRIGNQLFIYAFAESLRQKRNRNEKIVFNDNHVLRFNWKNSLMEYNIENVEYVHSKSLPLGMKIRSLILKLSYHLTGSNSYRGRFLVERKLKKIWSKLGIIACQNGFIDIPMSSRNKLYVIGYYQSPLYFSSINDYICDILRLDKEIHSLQNEDINKIRSRNSVCISIKVEHNVGNAIYDVCGNDYWNKAIEYVIERVENPLFFICSDNIEYVKNKLIDTDKFDTICQSKELPVHMSLAIMGLCKHFIIGNTSFGWWAQHISENPEKIVIVPKPWTRVDIPVDIYEDYMHCLDVTKYIENGTE